MGRQPAPPPTVSPDHTVRFLLDGEEVQCSGFAPTTTLLTWLRESRGRCGTKEGCAEGDCGACTVVVAEAVEGRIAWRSVNACIQLLATLHGKALYTVESLREPDGTLHPAQQAMIDCHASQCGFCTPGFVMSLFALYRNQSRADNDAVTDALSGNLCRCTGYRPIVDAAQRMYALPAPAEDADRRARETALYARLQALEGEADLVLAHAQGRYLAPRTLASFANCYADNPDATVLAGGTDIGLWITKHFRPLPLLLHLGRVRELAAIRQHDGALEIGAAVRLEDAFRALVAHYPDAAGLHRRFASLPIRNAGTLCGNIANGSPIGDSMPALIALGAEVVLHRAGQQRRLALEDLYLGYQQKALAAGEFVEAVRIPLPRAAGDVHFRAWKVSRRHDQDISAVFAGFALQYEDGRITRVRLAYGGMAATPRRAYATEAALLGRPFDAAALADARRALQQDFTPLSDVRASAEYRMRVAQNLLTRLQLETSGGARAASSLADLGDGGHASI
ncbi:xanthine dehydrogenase small subunit [Azoarcus olearius]|uniref:Xanthine dehydrogenase n=1 Tax=Azoarcus sp. (strain BH72) TaxID=418699 RepID=A1K7M3_AZOSB|nr:xanthine dehydrogenase small subunit [Azoarcus olearius]CAL94828.1 xanthine dehydrogenase [Azoarcus olearius]